MYSLKGQRVRFKPNWSDNIRTGYVASEPYVPREVHDKTSVVIIDKDNDIFEDIPVEDLSIISEDW